MTDKEETDKEDEDLKKLFNEAMRDVQPLKQTPRHHQQPRKPASETPESTFRLRRQAAENPVKEGGSALSEAWIEPVEPEQKLSFSRSGIQQTRLRQLRQGQLDVQYQLDLHGYKIEEARELVVAFISYCRGQKMSCIRIIHGKAYLNTNRQSTLKSHVNHWLRQLPDVLAFCSAPPSEGGTGSVLVLLKRK